MMIKPHSRWAAGFLIVLAATLAGPCRGAASVAVGEQLRRLVEADWVAEDRDYAPAAARPKQPPDLHQSVRKVTTAQDAAGGCDGVKNGLWGFHVASGEHDPWWQVDLGRERRLARVVVYNRLDGNSAARTRNLRILVGTEMRRDVTFREVYRHDGSVFGGTDGKPLVVDFSDRVVQARVVRLMVPGRCSFALDEVEVYSAAQPEQNLAQGRPADQISISPHSRPGTMAAADYARYGLRPMGGDTGHASDGSKHFSLAHTSDVLARARRLAARLAVPAGQVRMAPFTDELDRLSSRVAELQAANAPEDARREFYFRARRLVRRIAFANPLLDFDRLLFIKRQHPGGPFHMCDQYYGCNAKPGGGLVVLEQPFSEHPELTDLLAGATVEDGRLAGQALSGAVLSPELSFDGETILFAHSECQAKKTYTWGPEISFHLFKIGSDGSRLRQLTDGEADDFDPCFLPNGRIAFISLRRGGYLRCGRHCPTYTLFSMAPDGSDIIHLSYHETHEWQPSVSNDGMIVYTRWDYVDRDTNVAHHLWTCYPDGRDPRSLHGNYPVRREARPWMEMSIRAIPGSHRFVATAAAHHGHAFGSLVLIDPRPADDRAMSQVTRLTPEVPFPEAEGKPVSKYMVYGTPWPLSEDDYLVAYAADARHHGIYWLDRDGNRELIYRDPAIPCMSPIPLRPRSRPPVIPDATRQTAAARQALPERPATIAVTNVYDSDFEWPAGTEVNALRIIQVLPKTTPPPNVPRIGVANQTNARAVLGTVPVEADGSAFFEAPVGKLIYFQALDAEGLAVMSMRSGTYVHPGEQLSCVGCHEPKRSTRAAAAAPMPLAFRRRPSVLTPDVAGSAPFSYPRLVQPVLDRHCVSCHAKHPGKAPVLAGTPGKANGWTRSYESLAARFGFYYHVGNGSIKQGVHGGSRTIPGQFGARAAKLYAMLRDGHHKLQLSPEDLHRIALWLDCNSEFYGSYENTAAQARGDIVQATLE